MIIFIQLQIWYIGVCQLINVVEIINSLMNGNYLPEAALKRLSEYFSPLERLKLQQCCRRFHEIYGKWLDIVALDIRIVVQNGKINISFFIKNQKNNYNNKIVIVIVIKYSDKLLQISVYQYIRIAISSCVKFLYFGCKLNKLKNYKIL